MIDTKTGFRVAMLRQATSGHWVCILTDDVQEPMTYNRYVADLTVDTMEGPFESLMSTGAALMKAAS